MLEVTGLLQHSCRHLDTRAEGERDVWCLCRAWAQHLSLPRTALVLKAVWGISLFLLTHFTLVLHEQCCVLLAQAQPGRDLLEPGQELAQGGDKMWRHLGSALQKGFSSAAKVCHKGSVLNVHLILWEMYSRCLVGRDAVLYNNYNYLLPLWNFHIVLCFWSSWYNSNHLQRKSTGFKRKTTFQQRVQTCL